MYFTRKSEKYTQSKKFSEVNHPAYSILPEYLKNLISKKNQAMTEYSHTQAKEKYFEFQTLNRAVTMELLSVKENLGRSVIKMRLMPVRDRLSKFIKKTIGESVRNRLVFQTTRHRSVQKKFKGLDAAIKKLLVTHEEKKLEDGKSLSDPYVKFKCGGRLVYKSRTVYRDLNPVWDESFTVPIEDPFIPISIKVFDYDWGLQDDFMGSATLDLTSLDLSRPTDLSLALHDSARLDSTLGEIILAVTLYPKSQEDKEQLPMIYKAQIRPVLEYCSHIWGSAPKHTLMLLDSIQRRVIRLVGDAILTHSLTSLEHRRKVGNLSLFYRNFHGKCSSEISAIIPSLAMPVRRSRQAQSAHPFVVNLERCRTALYQNSFIHRTARLWNSLPEEVFPTTYNLQKLKKVQYLPPIPILKA
ncbi:unnamed protein product [Phaedon cochleariae]|uniref:C2 domain-containing protein n=1 Tax=Phaedon cochleariae TaxID=80249 RepID=A0A9N9X007_PHACE|nr:unnamed protein product [Phaedon cochleariae]